MRPTDTDGDRAASVYTIMQTANINGVNPQAYPLRPMRPAFTCPIAIAATVIFWS